MANRTGIIDRMRSCSVRAFSRGRRSLSSGSSFFEDSQSISGTSPALRQPGRARRDGRDDWLTGLLIPTPRLGTRSAPSSKMLEFGTNRRDLRVATTQQRCHRSVTASLQRCRPRHRSYATAFHGGKRRGTAHQGHKEYRLDRSTSCWQPGDRLRQNDQKILMCGGSKPADIRLAGVPPTARLIPDESGRSGKRKP